MAQEIREFVVLVPHGTPQTAPLVTSIRFPERVVTGISWRVPPGPSGKMGWALTSSGTPVIPIQPNTYIVTDNQADAWQLEGYLDSGNWQVTAYNTGLYDHTVYLTFRLDLIGAASSAPPQSPDSGIGIVGAVGTITAPPSPPPSPGSSPPPPADDSAAVVTAVLGAVLQQLTASGG